MKKASLVASVSLLLVLAFPNISRVPFSASATQELWSTPALSEDVPREPLPDNFTAEDYLNTTNPYSQINPLGEENEEEGPKPIYVLVFGDEEERARHVFPNSWIGYAFLQLERGDEALVANFGIDIRVLGFLEWDTDDSLNLMNSLWYELEADTKQYLHQWYDGEWWSNYVDAIVGITAQATTDRGAGRAPSPNYLDYGRTFVLLKWQAYWADDNLVQHEVSHLYYAPDQIEPQPPAPCCPMANHTHYQYYIWEDGLWWVFSDVLCAYTTYSWCTTCNQTIQQNSGRYLIHHTLTVYSTSGGTTDPAPGTYVWDHGFLANATATEFLILGYLFDYWLLDGTQVYDNPITVTMDSDHVLWAYFAEPSCAMKTLTNGSFYVPNTGVDLLKVEMLFDNANLTGDQTGGTSPYSSISKWPDGHVNAKDAAFVGAAFGSQEGDANWNYMADIVPDRIINSKDTILIGTYFGRSGSYMSVPSGVTVTFNTGQQLELDQQYDCVAIPEGAVNFTVKRNGTPIGALVTFLEPLEP